MSAERRLDWAGCVNVRDLGGLPVAGGRTTRFRAVVRSDQPDDLDAAGWRALRAYGVRTIVDLRNGDERPARPAGRNGLATVHVPLDGIEHADFWEPWTSGPQFGTPLYYRPHLERFPERSARAVAAVARAQPGGVLVHCVGGRDRTGQVVMLLLALVGVSPDVIAADYALTEEGRPEAEEFLAGRGTTVAAVIASTLAGLDLEAHLRAAGLTDDDFSALRARLLS